MSNINIEEILQRKAPGYFTRAPRWAQQLNIRALNSLLRLPSINRFLQEHSNAYNFDFIDEVFEYFDFSYMVAKKDRDRIPSEGKLIIVSNHPLGGLDGLALLKLISEVRKDVKIVVNDVLMHLDNLRDLFLPVDVLGSGSKKENLENIDKALQRGEAVIFFPAGEVSRLSISGVKDSQWSLGALRYAKKHQADVLPVFIKAKNSMLFYTVSSLWKKASMLLLPGEIFRMQGKNISVVIGNPISASVISGDALKLKQRGKMLRRHVEKIGKGKPGIFKTEKPVIHPVESKVIRKQLYRGQYLGENFDGKQQFIVTYSNAPDVVKEIARLREITFRKIGEGTGKKADTDTYDRTYRHLVLWDDNDSEIVGAYRIGHCPEILQKEGVSGLYTSTLFSFTEEFTALLPRAAELGRSFVQAKYWNTNALDYLWQGIGAYLAAEPSIRYLFGGVSLSGAYPPEAIAHIVFYFRRWFGSEQQLLQANNQYAFVNSKWDELAKIYPGIDQKAEQKLLKQTLKQWNVAIPPLYKQYTALCDDGGAKFLDFGIDPDFANCIDGLILVDISKMKAEKKMRYLKTAGKEQAA